MEKSDFLKQMEKLWRDSAQLSEIRGVLIANYDNPDDPRALNIIDDSSSTYVMLMTILEYHNKPICECKVCGKSFNNNEDLYIHYDEKHNQK